MIGLSCHFIHIFWIDEQHRLTDKTNAIIHHSLYFYEEISIYFSFRSVNIFQFYLIL